MKKTWMTMIMLVAVISCSSTEVPKTTAVEEKPTVVSTKDTQEDTDKTEQKTSGNKPVKNTLNKIAKPFKKFGSDVEQAFDRLSTKDKDGDGE